MRDGSDGRVTVLVNTQRNRKNEFYQIGFDAKRPPIFPGVSFLPLSTSPVIPVTNGFVEIHQIAGDHAPAGGDLSILEIWQVDPVPLPGDFVAAFAFGADGFTRESPNAPVTYKKIVQGGLDFDYSAERGYGYSDLSGLDKSPNNPNVLDGEAELYDQFIGAKPGGKKIVFRVDVPNGEYRFVAAGGDIRNRNHRTSILVRDGSTGVFLPFVEELTNKDNEFYRVGFRDKHAPEATGVHFLPEVDSPKLEVTQGYIELHQLAVRPSAGGGDLSLLEIWQAVPPPTVAIELPDDGTFLTSSAVPVRVSYTDAFDVKILVDAVDRSSELTIGSDVADGVLSVPDGRHELEAIVTNPAGSASATHTFTVDAEAPVLELDPVPEYTATTPLTVTGTLRDRDPAATVDCPSAVLTLETTSPDGVRTWSFTCAFPLTEGANTLDVTASDTGGRQASASASTTLDTAAPELTIVSPTPDFYTNVDTISVSGGVFDDSPVTVVAGSVTAVVTGTSFNASGVSIHDGSNLIVIVATDAAGNTQEKTVTVFFDIDPPIVTLKLAHRRRYRPLAHHRIGYGHRRRGRRPRERQRPGGDDRRRRELHHDADRRRRPARDRGQSPRLRGERGRGARERHRRLDASGHRHHLSRGRHDHGPRCDHTRGLRERRHGRDADLERSGCRQRVPNGSDPHRRRQHTRSGSERRRRQPRERVHRRGARHDGAEPSSRRPGGRRRSRSPRHLDRYRHRCDGRRGERERRDHDSHRKRLAARARLSRRAGTRARDCSDRRGGQQRFGDAPHLRRLHPGPSSPLRARPRTS